MATTTSRFDFVLSSITTYLDTKLTFVKGLREASQELPTTSLGPNGTRLDVDELVVQHCAAKALVLAAQKQQKKFGDGANLAVSIASQHLEGAIHLITSGLSPSEIINGYKKASNQLGEILEALVEEGSETMDVRNRDQVILRMKAPVSSKLYDIEHVLCPLIADACIRVCPKNPVNFYVHNVRVAKLFGSLLGASRTFRGMVLKPETVVGNLKRIENAKVLVIAGGVGNTATETNRIHQCAKTKEEEAEDENRIIELIKGSGAKVIVSGAALEYWAISRCNLEEIMVLTIPSQSEFECFCRTTDAVPLLELKSNIDPSYLGYVDHIIVDMFPPNNMVTVTNEQGGVATVLLGVRDTNVISDVQLQNAVVKVVNTYKALCRDSRIVPGAGATEIEIARQLKEFALKQTGFSDQVAIEKFAESFELIPETLARNFYLHVEDIIKTLYSDHAAGNVKVGIDLKNEDCKDVSTLNIWDLYTIKNHALQYAADAVSDVLSVFQEPKRSHKLIDTALEVVKKTLEQYVETRNQVHESSITEDNEELKTSLAILSYGDRIFFLSGEGTLHCTDTLCNDYWHLDVSILPRYSQSISDIGPCSIIKYSKKPQEIVFDKEERFGKKSTYSPKADYELSTRIYDYCYLHPDTGQHVATSTPHISEDILCVRRSEIQVTWYNKGAMYQDETRKRTVLCYLRIYLYDLLMVTLNDRNLVPKPRPPKVVENFIPGSHDVEWYAKNSEGVIVPQQLPIRVISVAKGRASEETVHSFISSIIHASNRNMNILKVCYVRTSKDSCNFNIETYGKSLRVFIQQLKKPLKNDEKKELIRGVLNALRGLHTHRVTVGNLTIDDVFVDVIDGQILVKIAPITGKMDLPSSFLSSPSKKRWALFDGNFSPDTLKADMYAAGVIMFYCYKGEEFYSQSLYDKSVVAGIPLDAHNLLWKLINSGTSPITAKEACAHTVFWPGFKHLEFIRSIWEKIKDNYQLRDLLKNIESVFRRKPHNWKESLPHQFITLMERHNYGDLPQEDGQGYNGSNICVLFQVLRHLLAHEEEIRKQALAVLRQEMDFITMFDRKKGFASFIMERFPTLSYESYNALKVKLEKDENFLKFYALSNPSPSEL